MTLLNTKYPTLVFNSMPLIDPSTIKQIMGKRTKKHERKTQDNPQGAIVEREASIHYSNVKKAE